MPHHIAHMLIEKLRPTWFLLPALYSMLCGNWAVKTLTSPLSWNSKHAIVSGVGPAIVNTLFSFFGLTYSGLYLNTFLTDYLESFSARGMCSAFISDFISNQHFGSRFGC